MLICDDNKFSDDGRKWLISAVSAIVFLVFAAPFTYQLTDRYIARPLGLKYLTEGGAVTNLGLLVHTLVFFLVIRLLMW